MTQRQPPPAESDLLCEFCGYILNGLERTGATNCPECGKPLAPSVEPGHRQPAPIERAASRNAFWRTTIGVIVRKRRFFRETLSRPGSAGIDDARVARFGLTHRIIAGALFGIAAATHLAWMAETRVWVDRWEMSDILLNLIAGVVLVGLGIVALVGVTKLATRLTTTESRFWGMRLPRPVVARAMNFHAANYLPIGIIAVLLTVGFRLALIAGIVSPIAGVPYLLTLSAAVVVAAIWLFESYVIAMRRIRYANF